MIATGGKPFAAGCVAGALGAVLAFVNPGPSAWGGESQGKLSPVADAVHDDTKVGFAYRVQGEKLLWEGDFGGAIESFAQAIWTGPFRTLAKRSAWLRNERPRTICVPLLG